MVQQINVEYAAEQELTNPNELSRYVQTEITQHISSLDDVHVSDWDLQIQISSFTFAGKVKMELSGTIDDKTVKATLLNVNKRPHMSARKGYGTYVSKREYEQRNGAILAFVWFICELLRGTVRFMFPSEPARAVGRSFFVGRALRSLDDCLADIRILIDEKIERPESGGHAKHRSAFWTALVTLIVSLAAALVWFVLGSGGANDPTRGIFGCLLIGGGAAGVIYGWNLFMIPKRFFRSEKSGREFLRRSGLGTSGCATTAGVVLFVCSFLSAALGLVLLIKA